MLRTLHITLLAAASLPVLAQPVYEVSMLDTRAQSSDYAPVPLDSGFVMCSIRENAGAIGFTDATTDLPLADLYWVPLRNGAPGVPVLFSAALATPVNEGPASFADGGRTICYTRNQILPKKLSNLRDGNGQLGLFFSRYENEAWQQPTAFVHNVSAHSLMHPAFSADGLTLYFASDMPGGTGGMDLYRSTRTAEGWSAPENLGPSVNGPANEVFPTVQPDGSLCFSSDRVGGQGKLDILRTKPSGRAWTRPEALPDPVNSASNDICYTAFGNGLDALFSSDRSGADRVYASKLTVPKFRDCAEQRLNNYCYAFKGQPHAATRTLPLEHVWEMGDGTRTAGLDAQHCYAGPGTYTVRSLLVDSKSGAIFHELRSDELVIANHEQAFITAPDTVRTGRALALESRNSYVSWTAIAEHHWDMGDGTRTTGASTQHKYATAGTYEVKLDLLSAPDATGTIQNRCNTKRIVVIDRFHDQEDMAVVATYQDASGEVHSFEFQELPFDQLAMDGQSNDDVRFAVELFASKDRVSLDDPRFEEVRKLYRVVERFDPARGVYTYSVGESETLEELYEVYRKVKELQFLDAEVFALQVEKLMDLSELDMASLQDLNNSKLRTNAIHFAFKSADLDEDSAPVLEQVMGLLRQHPQLQLVIEAHTDDVGGLRYNVDLSQQRAKAVVDHLTAKGVGAERLIPVGHGKNQPIASNKTEEGRSQNRRVEFRMIVKEEAQAFEKTR